MTNNVKIYRIYLKLRRQTIDLWRCPVQPQTAQTSDAMPKTKSPQICRKNSPDTIIPILSLKMLIKAKESTTAII